MNKLKILRIVNMLLLLSFIIQIATSLLMFFRIKTHFSSAIFEIHEYNGITFISLAVFHIVLNWGWIKNNFFPKKHLDISSHN